MTVHVLIPVFNRLEMTRSMIACLDAQHADTPLNIIVVDDGSTDGTSEYLASLPGITVLRGDGSLWWGGSIDLALRHVFQIGSLDDWVLFVNNDTQLKPDFVQTLLDAARCYSPSAVGSVIRNERAPHCLLSVGARIDAWKMIVTDRSESVDCAAMPDGARDVVSVDALSGRGALFPVAVLKSVKGMRPRWLPHYLADYELSLRVKSTGCKLLVALGAAVYSNTEFGGSTYRAASIKARLFSVRSPAYLPAVLIFWWEASSWIQRLTFPLRVALFRVFPGLRKKNV